MSAKDTVGLRLSKQFASFLASATENMQDLYNSQEAENLRLLEQEVNCNQEIIENKDFMIQELISKIAAMKSLKKTRTDHLYFAFIKSENSKNLKRTLSAWIKFHDIKLQKKKMMAYVLNFHRRGVIGRNYKAWRTETQKLHKQNVNQATIKRIQNEVATASQAANDEAELLRTMVNELTEDLRNETIAKNSLKYKFEQALLRGMSALNIETMGIHQDIISQARSFSETSRGLLYTPEKFGYLTRS